MKAYVITIEGNEISETASQHCIESSWRVKNEFPIERFDAIVPGEVKALMRHQYKIEWNYPWEGEVLDFATGLVKKAYPTRNKDARIACALSHLALWEQCFDEREPILVLEHDAIFTKKLSYESLLKFRYGIIGINEPFGATRMATVFHRMVQESKTDVANVPRIDNIKVPQGLAGNSAYVIKPWAAEEMLELVNDFGLWPNDALMCYQLFPLLGVSKTYYTKVQRTASTTTL